MTLDDLFAYCVGTIGMSVSEYNDSTYGEILCVMHGYAKQVSDQSRERWEQARHIAYYSVVAHVKPGSVSSPKNLIPMPWDIQKAQFKDKAEHEQAMENVMSRLKFRADRKKREEIKSKQQTKKKNGKHR